MTRRRRWIASAVVAVVGLLAVFTWQAGRLLVVRGPSRPPDAIISLASHEWERLPESAALARKYRDSLVILTLPQEVTRHRCHDCANRVRHLERMGVKPSRVRVLPLNQPGTFGEAVACRDFVRQTNVKRVTIVTSPYHTRRALAVFSKLFDGIGVEVTVQPSTATSPAQPDRWWTDPYDRWYVAYEWAAIAFYTVRYRVISFM